MASHFRAFLALVALVTLFASPAHAQLSERFYAKTCPSLQGVVRSGVAQAVRKELRMGASLLRLFFHDCFVNGCDGSILLDDTPPIFGEKTAFPNVNSVRGYEVIDAIKANVESVCKATVSCADIIALAARDAVVLLGGPTWTVQLGRRDALTANITTANTDLPPPFANLTTLISMFAAKGMSAQEMTVMSGAHTIGRAQCTNFRAHVYNDTNIDPGFATLRKQTCPSSGGDANLAPFDVQSPDSFDNQFYKNLMAQKGLLHSDQLLFNNDTQDSLVRQYSKDGGLFARDFAAAMVKLGAISPLTGINGEIRLNCRQVNPAQVATM